MTRWGDDAKLRAIRSGASAGPSKFQRSSIFSGSSQGSTWVNRQPSISSRGWSRAM